MTHFLQIKNGEDSETIEVPTEEDGTLPLSSLENLYPSVIGLKYNVDGHVRLVKAADGVLLPPTDGWGKHLYYCLYQKDNKRKAEDSDDNPSKSSKADTNGDAKNARWTYTDLVVLGLAWKTTDKELYDYFSKFGELQFAQVKVDPITKKSKGYGFIRFTDNEVQVRVMLQRHEIDGRWCDVRVPQSKDGLSKKPSGKIFVGQCTEDMTEDDLRAHFGKFGDISDVYVPKPFRGFAFVTFVDPDSAQVVCRQQHHINDKKVLVTEAIPKNASKDRYDSGGYGGRSSRSSRSGARGRDDDYYRDRYSSDYSRRDDKGWRGGDSRYDDGWYSSGTATTGGGSGSRTSTWSSRRSPTWRDKTPPDSNISSDLVAKVVNKAVLGVIENLKGGQPAPPPEVPDRDSWWSRR